MRRLLSASVVVSMFCLTGAVGADEKAALSVESTLKVDTSTGAAFTFVYVSGASLYPDGTKIFIGLRSPHCDSFLKVVSAIVHKGLFVSEIGPWEQHFPPGRYHVVAEFRYEDQDEALQKVLDSSRDLETCMKNNEEYRKRYYLENPERAKLFDEYIARTGRCPGKSGFAETDLVVGTPDQIERTGPLEEGQLQGYADVLEELASGAAVPGEAEQVAAWRVQLGNQLAAVHNERVGVVCTKHPESWALLENACMNLELCAGDSVALTQGPGAGYRADIAALEGKGAAADRDDRRHLTSARAALAALDRTREAHARAAVNALAQVLYGNQGLKPAPERAKKYEADLLEKFGVKPE